MNIITSYGSQPLRSRPVAEPVKPFVCVGKEIPADEMVPAQKDACRRKYCRKECFIAKLREKQWPVGIPGGSLMRPYLKEGV